MVWVEAEEFVEAFLGSCEVTGVVLALSEAVIHLLAL